MSEKFEPRIVAFCCNYCAFAAADLAGSMRIAYPTNARIIRLPCSGRADIQHVLQAFLDGADGVLVLGCMDGDCHFLQGNFKAKRRIARAKNIIKDAGIEPERLEMYQASSAMGPRFAEIVTQTIERIRLLGPCPTKKHANPSTAAATGSPAATEARS